jgi:ATP-dependent Lon protease
MANQEAQSNLKPIQIPLLPLRELLVFPTTVVPLFVGRDKSIQALEQAMASNKEILLCAQQKAKIDDPGPGDIFLVGTIASVLQLLRLPDGTVKVLVEGKRRAKIINFLKKDDFFYVEAQPLEDIRGEGLENEALLRTVKIAFDNYVRLNKRIPPELLLTISQIEDESKLSDTLVSHLSSLKLEEKQKLLEQIDARVRLEDIYGYIQSEIEIMRVEKKIRARVKRQMEKTQKEYYLNEQMAAIQKELGDRDDVRTEISEIEKQIKTKKLTEEVREKLTKEVRKLKSMSPMSAEATVVRNYIETVLSLPWQEYSEEKNDIAFAEQVLDRDHYGLDKVKDRILEYLSVRTLAGNLKGPILCLVGPPGVGKTSLAKSVAEATGRSFIRIALGGVSDEAEIRGHRRTYIGSMPGKIIQGLKKAGTSNPLMLLDEVDKMTSNFRGDPASALLEVLDPAQNHTFNDHYLDMDYDLSKVLFFATANSYSSIPRPLLDRMELIHLSGYTEEEKLQIGRSFLLDKQLKENGLDKQSITFTVKAFKEIIHYYTREAGVRSLEREIASVLRKVARRHLKKLSHAGEIEDEEGTEMEASAPVKAVPVKESAKVEEAVPVASGVLDITEIITEKSIQKYLGPHKYRIGTQNDKDEVGLATGLAYTDVGGELLVVEISILPGKGKISLTGKLGEVMRESAQAAISYVRSRSQFLGIDPDFYQTKDIHIHVPEGAIPKDGPSAGICMATAITSALTERPVNRFVAMTGEITLRGRVLPIGGLKEKVMAAHRGGITKVIIPRDNKKDLRDIPKQIAREIKFVAVDHMDEVLIHALAWKAEKDHKIQDELFTRLQNVVATEFDMGEVNVAH